MSVESRIFLTLLVIASVYYSKEDPRAWNWIKAQWARSVGAWFARRRARIRVGEQETYSAGITVSRRDIITGSWT